MTKTKESKTVKQFKLLFDVAATEMVCSAEETYKQMLGDFSQREIEEMFDGPVECADKYEMKRYALYEDENKNLLMVTTSCEPEDYQTDSDLPDTDELFHRFINRENCGDLVDTLFNVKSQVLYLSQIPHTAPDYVRIIDESFYDEISGENIFLIMGKIEKYVSSAMMRSVNSYKNALIVNGDFQQDKYR